MLFNAQNVGATYNPIPLFRKHLGPPSVRQKGLELSQRKENQPSTLRKHGFIITHNNH